MIICPDEFWCSSGVGLKILRESMVSEEYVGWLNDPEVNKYLECRLNSNTIDTTRKFVAETIIDSGALFFAILIKNDDKIKHIGNVKLQPINRYHGFSEIGIMIGDKNYWGKGIGSKVIKIISEISKNQLGLRKLTAGCYLSNMSSYNMFIKSGFKKVGERPLHCKIGNSFDSILLLDKFL